MNEHAFLLFLKHVVEAIEYIQDFLVFHIKIGYFDEMFCNFFFSTIFQLRLDLHFHHFSLDVFIETIKKKSKPDNLSVVCVL